MHEALFNYISNYTSKEISNEHIEYMKSVFQPSKVRRKQYFLREGDICKEFAFIVKGAMRQYTVDEKGAEHIVALGIENWWIGDRESWVTLTPSVYTIEAWEDCEILTVTRESIINLVQLVPAFNELLLLLDERNKIANQKRITSSIGATAEKRYSDFIENHPDFMQRFPQHIIASFLGITKETLSRVRKSYFGK